MSGSISPTSELVTYSGTLSAPNAGGNANMPICNVAQPCDNFNLGVSVPDSGYSVSVSVLSPARRA